MRVEPSRASGVVRSTGSSSKTPCADAFVESRPPAMTIFPRQGTATARCTAAGRRYAACCTRSAGGVTTLALADADATGAWTTRGLSCGIDAARANGSTSRPSGVSRYPGAVPLTSVWPYCQTMRCLGDADQHDTIAVVVVDRDQAGLSPHSASDGWSSAPGPERGPYRQSTRPVVVTMMARPGLA